MKPVPGVDRTTPRGEFTLKKSAGRRLGSARLSGTPSQLISRRTPPNEPFAPGTVPPPIAARNASRLAVTVPRSPDALNGVIIAADAPPAKRHAAPATNHLNRFTVISLHRIGNDRV